MPKIAVLDLGTNTFHLLIVDTDEQPHFQELHRAREFVKLAEDGIDTLSEGAWRRGLKTMIGFRKTIDRFDVDEIKAVGTAAIRTAENGLDFIGEIRKMTGILVVLIEGSQEAELIYRGVSKVWEVNDLPALIMDIGGGSVEFIIADQHGSKWARSYPIGVAVLFRNHHTSDPISKHEQRSLRLFLRPCLQELDLAINQFRPSCLIGASGTFDVLLTFLGETVANYNKIEIDQVGLHLAAIIDMDHLTRENDDRIPATRVDMIVVAAILIQIVLDLHQFEKMSVSQYALKEGLL